LHVHRLRLPLAWVLAVNLQDVFSCSPESAQWERLSTGFFWPA
jgi:hypothetical protein